MFRFGKFIICLGILVALFMITGCAQTFHVKNPIPSSVVYDQALQESIALKINDQRAGEDLEISSGTLTVELKNLEDEILFLGSNLEKAFNSRGINVKYSTEDESGLKLVVNKYSIRNIRISGFSPYWTYTTFSGDMQKDGKVHKITFYFESGKTPIWSFNEVEDPCYNVPVSLMVKEIASKINRLYFGLKAPDTKVASLTEAINGKLDESTFLKVLELGYTNNPEAVEPLVKLAGHEDSMVRMSAICSLGMLGAVEKFDFLKNLYDSAEGGEKSMVLKSIGDLGSPEAVEFLKSVKNSSAYQDEMIQEAVDLYL